MESHADSIRFVNIMLTIPALPRGSPPSCAVQLLALGGSGLSSCIYPMETGTWSFYMPQRLVLAPMMTPHLPFALPPIPGWGPAHSVMQLSPVTFEILVSNHILPR